MCEWGFNSSLCGIKKNEKGNNSPMGCNSLNWKFLFFIPHKSFLEFICRIIFLSPCHPSWLPFPSLFTLNPLLPSSVNSPVLFLQESRGKVCFTSQRADYFAQQLASILHRLSGVIIYNHGLQGSRGLCMKWEVCVNVRVCVCSGNSANITIIPS